MAQTKRKRRRKHRGTQAGAIDRGGRRGRPRSREQAKAQARRRTQDRRDVAPTWRSAFYRGLFGGVIFFALALFLLGQPIGGALGLAVVMVAMYVPLGYYVDSFMYRRRMAQQQKKKQEQRERE
ncbi:MAG: hypothetical protein GEU88_03985 [Solirubrobacterales bacterium]|nr:hypothetical protein [Solirubrobacterales bacterium]